MTLWQDITAAALLGTERQRIPTFASGDALGETLAQITRTDNPDREAALLGAAAAISLYQQAGQVPIVDNQPLPDPAPPEDRPRCSSNAGVHLAAMLGGEFTDVLPEWLVTLDAAGQRVPEEYLPILLNKGQQYHMLRQTILRVIGERGPWLIHNKSWWNWSYALAGYSERIWERGNTMSRATLLEGLHATEPDSARALLASIWNEERAEDRVAFLTAITP